MPETTNFLNIRQARDVSLLMSAENAYQEVKTHAHPQIAAQFWSQIKQEAIRESGMSEEEFEFLSTAARAYLHSVDLAAEGYYA